MDFNGVKVFDNATVDSCILQICKESPKDNMIAYATPTQKDLSTLNYSQINQDSLSSEAFIFVDSPTLALKQKIERIGTPLKQWDIEINYGIKTGYNEAFIIDTATKDRILDSCESVAEKERTAQIIKPILRGRDIKRYSYEWAGLWLILAKFDSHKYLEKDYPTIYKHLLQYKEALQARGQCRYARGKESTGKGYKGQHHWLELDNNPKDSYIGDFEKPKISWQRVTQEPSFILEKDFYLLDSMAFLVSNSKQELYYLLAFLNSKAVFWYFKNIGHLYSDKGFLLSNQYVSRFPIPKINAKNKKIADKIVNLVDKILQSKAQGKDSTQSESQIDDLVYKLYNLNSSEIQIIQGD